MPQTETVAKKILGAALLSVDESSVNGILGFLKIIRHDNFLALLLRPNGPRSKHRSN
jgi:hypothetical protein